MSLPRIPSPFGIVLIVLVFLAPAPTMAEGLEKLINERFADFPLTPDNKHRLAAWSELKGDYSPQTNTLSLDFGDIGKLEVYTHNFLLRIGNSGVYHLDRRRTHPRDVAIMNETLREIFEQISLLANHNAHPDLIYFVDEHLAKKNLEPFEKLYLRHILIKFGRFDAARRVVEFRTEWLPVTSYEYEVPGESGTILIRKPIDPLLIKLDEATVRGYYLQEGGTVYVEDVNRDVFYATGEGYSPNIVAFKHFLQELFTQTTHYVVKEEEERIKQAKMEGESPAVVATSLDQAPPASPKGRPRGYVRGQQTAEDIQDSPGIKSLYSRHDWMGRMIGVLRYHNTLTDQEVAGFLVNQPFFLQLYKHFTPEEKAYYNRFR